MPNLFLKPLAAVLVFILFAIPALAMDIKEVTSPGGIKAWLVEDKTIPLIAMQYSFKGGGALDPAGLDGVSHFLTGMMDEGAGDLDSAAFQKKRDELAFRMSFDASLDYFEGGFQTLSRNRDPSFALLKLAITSPRFDAEPLERVRQQFLIAARDDREDPDKIASRAWMAAALGSHPYARLMNGSEQTLAAIAAADLAAAHRRIFVRKTLQIAVVGDIDAATLARLLDETFGGLPEGTESELPALVEPVRGPSLKVIERDIPQSIIVFGHGGILRNDPDFFPAHIMSQVLGGGGFGSRLTEEIREKRGLTYGVGAGLVPLDRAGLFMGSLATRNEKAGEALALVRDVLKRMGEEGPTARELAEAKTYLTGSYALRFDSNAKIAGQLLGIQQENLGLDYIDRRNAMVEAVTLEQVKAQAKRLLDADRLIVTIVGRPQGLS
ncbi:MAG: M16 family metallopeptidase [Hyphomicrobiales bacterium]